MPAVTRSQSKNIQKVVSDNVPQVNLLKDVVPIHKCAVPKVNPLPYQHVVTDECTCLIMRLKLLLASMNEPNFDKQTKIITTTGIYSLLNSEMMKHEKLYKSNKFVLTVFNQSFELEKQLNDINLSEGVDLKIIENLRTELIKIRPTLKALIEKMEDNPIWQYQLVVARIHMNKIQRPRRNVKRVNYAGMDMNEDDEGEFNVCKIWYENDKVSYKWSKRPLAEVNELYDSNYQL